MKPHVSILIPVYGSEKTVNELHSQILKMSLQLKKKIEVIYIDDCSPDNVWKVLQGLKNNSWVSVQTIQLMRNYGQHNATLCGLRHARGEWLVTIDDDLQNLPSEIPSLLETAENENLDLLYGVYAEKKHALYRNLGSLLVNIFFKMVFKTPARMSSYRVIRKCLAETVVNYHSSFIYLDGLLAWNTQRIGNMVVTHLERREGRSGYSFSKLLTLSLNMFCNFSIFPLQAIFILGALVSFPSLGLAGFYLYRYLTNAIEVPGYASSILSILTFGGLQLFSLGLLGQYLGRLFLNVNQKPQYAERTISSGIRTRHLKAA